MKYSLPFRIWHWLHAGVVLGLLGTVFLRKTFLSWRDNSEILTTQLLEMGNEISQEQAKMLAKSIRAGMWEWHIILGYGLAALLLFRLYLFFKDDSLKVDFTTLDLHKKIVKISYYIFYALLGFMAVSGFVIEFYEFLSLTKESAHDIKEIHELLYNGVLIFVPLHIAGVVIAENRDERGLISSMVNGRS